MKDPIYKPKGAAGEYGQLALGINYTIKNDLRKAMEPDDGERKDME